jgi:GMP synthase (glutamine-hydrolysing)
LTRSNHPRILLLQARDAGDPVIPEEIAIFARNARVPLENVTPLNLLEDTPALAAAKTRDAVMIGGSGNYFVSKGNLPNFHGTLGFLAEAVEAGIPMFASCFGFQLIVRALGGHIAYKPEKMELGTYTLTLTGEGLVDDVFRVLPLSFAALLGHKDQATAFPAGLKNLAFSDFSPFQGLRVPGKPIWATQFHPEMTHLENLRRFKRYLNEYAKTMSPDEMEQTLNRFQPAPHTANLIPRFMEVVFG